MSREATYTFAPSALMATPNAVEMPATFVHAPSPVVPKHSW
jgi:hypothetical protein